MSDYITKHFSDMLSTCVSQNAQSLKKMPSTVTHRSVRLEMRILKLEAQ